MSDNKNSKPNKDQKSKEKDIANIITPTQVYEFQDAPLNESQKYLISILYNEQPSIQEYCFKKKKVDELVQSDLIKARNKLSNVHLDKELYSKNFRAVEQASGALYMIEKVGSIKGHKIKKLVKQRIEEKSGLEGKVSGDSSKPADNAVYESNESSEIYSIEKEEVERTYEGWALTKDECKELELEDISENDESIKCAADAAEATKHALVQTFEDVINNQSKFFDENGNIRGKTEAEFIKNGLEYLPIFPDVELVYTEKTTNEKRDAKYLLEQANKMLKNSK